MPKAHPRRSIGFAGATGIGVGAIVGGGILALAGVAFATTGPGAILAFALNGIIAIVTALSFAEMATRFPESGGSYAFARRVLPIEAAFVVGWIVWFASIVAAVLYAAGFSAFAMAIWEQIVAATVWQEPAWVTGRPASLALAIGSTVFFALILTRRAGGGNWINVIKVLVFGGLVVGGLWAFLRQPPAESIASLKPFLPRGGLGLVQAMGFTFIALQGFDLIAAVAGEIHEPRRTIPRSMLVALAIALGIYLPLLLVITTVGTEPGRTVSEMAADNPEQIVAVAALRFIGPAGFWIVLVAGLLAMLSALQANLLAASRVALAMARDRSLPQFLDRVHPERGMPVPAVLVTAALVVAIVSVIPDVASAGAAASLVFLVTFAIVHGIVLISRHRVGIAPGAFRVPFAPVLPALGGLTCVALAVFQGVVVPNAGAIIVAWLCVGGIIFLAVFAHRARVYDASAEALDPNLSRLRGRSPLVLVPVANPANAAAMVAVANAFAPPGVGRVLLLSVVGADERQGEAAIERPLDAVQAVFREALRASMDVGLSPEMLTTISPRPWDEIVRVARTHRCASVLLGLSDPSGELGGSPLERVMRDAGCDTVILRAPAGWSVNDATRILVPVGGRGDHDTLRARLVGHLRRTGEREIRYVQVIRPSDPPERQRWAARGLRRVAFEETGETTADVIRAEDPVGQLIREASACDLVILGVRRSGRRQRSLGPLVQRMARETEVPLILISRRG